MRAVRTSGTDLELAIASLLRARRLRFERNAKDLPGKPDIVFREQRVAVFIDGDFWHGYRFPLWKDRVSLFWQRKIEATRARDRRNFRKLRRAGWAVVRLWQHEVLKQPDRSVSRIVRTLQHTSHSILT